MKKYGISFDVPEGMEWVETEDADEYVEGSKKILDEYSACGAVMKYVRTSMRRAAKYRPDGAGKKPEI